MGMTMLENDRLPCTLPVCMGKFRQAILIATIFLTTLGTAGRADDALPGLFGRIQGDRYYGPGGLYSVTLPVLPELGGEVHDTDSVVTFDDNVSTHISVACFPLDAVQKTELETHGIKEYLAGFYSRFVLQDFQKRFPGTTAENTLFTPSVLDGALFGYTLLPGGSSFQAGGRVLDTPGDPPPVAKRGNLLFVKNEHIFVISIELAERVTQAKFFNKTPEEEDAILRERLLQMAERLHFPETKKISPQS
jgi:hypothetical protein